MKIKISSIDLSEVNQLITGVKGPALITCLSCGLEDIREPAYFCSGGCRVCGRYKASFEYPVPLEKLENKE